MTKTRKTLLDLINKIGLAEKKYGGVSWFGPGTTEDLQPTEQRQLVAAQKRICELEDNLRLVMEFLKIEIKEEGKTLKSIK